MHTSAFQTCRIHHNGGYDGDIYITNMDSTSKPLGSQSDIKYTTKDLCNLYRKMYEGKEDRDKDYPVTIKGIPEEGYGEEITISSLDIKSYVAAYLSDKIQEMLDRTSDNETLRIAKQLGIQW